MTIALAASTGGGSGGGGGGTGDPVGTAAAVLAAHEAATDPHASRSSQPSRDQTGDYTLASTDKGWRLRAKSASQSYTTPADTFAADDIVYFVSYGGSITWIAGVNMVINSPSSLTSGPTFGTYSLIFEGPREATLSGPVT